MVRRAAAKAAVPVRRAGMWTAASGYRVRELRRAHDRESVLDEVASRFDAAWYVEFYGVHLAGAAEPFDHYLEIGSRFGLSPSSDFDEWAYRQRYPDVARAIERGSWPSGFEHYLSVGGDGRRQASAVAPDERFPLHARLADQVREHFDPEWYVGAYADVAAGLRARGMPSPLWHYVTEGARTSRSPNGWFDEHWYLRAYRDVAAAKASGSLSSGFVHYLEHGRTEGRRTSPHPATASVVLLGELTAPVGLDRIPAIERRLEAFPFRIVERRGASRVNFVVPTVDRSVLFAGYIAALNFLAGLLDRGHHVRLLVTEDTECTSDRMRRQFTDDPLGMRVAEEAEVVNLARREQVLDISADDGFVAYSVWTARHAHIFASALDRQFVFFLQEYEPAFHAHDSMHALAAAAYDLPHFAMFNSEFLRRYFDLMQLGVFRRGPDHGRRASLVFEHALSVPRPPSMDELRRSTSRRVLVYARPEAHAARNLFELAVTGLRAAVAQGAFAGDWTFDGVGTLATETRVGLGDGRHMNLGPRMSYDDYAHGLRDYDVGLSLQYTPHPGVVHFEMAASGIVAVTNTFVNRSPEQLAAVSTNLVAVEPTPEAIARGLAEAAERAGDLPARVRGALGAWPTSWKESFDDHVMNAVESQLWGGEIPPRQSASRPARAEVGRRTRRGVAGRDPR